MVYLMMRNIKKKTAGGSGIACSLSASQLRIRCDSVRELMEESRGIQELEDGYSLSFASKGEWPTRLLEFIAVERRCCPFITFELVFEPHGGPLWLHLRGPDGVKTFLKDVLFERGDRS